MNRTAQLVSALVGLVILTHHAAAQDTANLTDVQVKARLAFIQDRLDEGRRAANLWWYGWLIGYSAATAGQIAVYSSTDSERTRQDMLVGSITSALGAGAQVVFPLQAGRLAAQLRAMPQDTPEARRTKLASAQSFLRLSAAQEELGRSWKAHALAGAVNLAAGLVIWRHYDRPGRDGLLTFAIGQLVSEVQIYSQPTRAIRDLREYEQRSEFDHAGAAAVGHRTWYVGALPGGILVGCRF